MSKRMEAIVLLAMVAVNIVAAIVCRQALHRYDEDVAQIRAEIAAWQDKEPERIVVVIEKEMPTEAKKEAAAPAAFYPLTDAQRKMIERVVAAEARGESYEGMAAVAQTIMQRCMDKGLPPEDIMIPGQYADPYMGEISEEVREAVAQIFDRGELAIDAPVMAFYSPTGGRSAWHENSLRYVTTIGAHRFFMEK